VCHVSLPSSYRSRRGHIHLLWVLPLVGCRSKTPTEASIPHTVRKFHGGAAKSPRGVKGAAARFGGEEKRKLGFLTRRPGPYIPLQREPSDPAASRGAPGDPAPVAGRPGDLQNAPGRPGMGGQETWRSAEPHRVNRAAMPVDSPPLENAQKGRF
jgi:hypothetical protein